MKPFSAWLAMESAGWPSKYKESRGVRFEAFSFEDDARGRIDPLPVLIVADTPENREKLGMEEGS